MLVPAIFRETNTAGKDALSSRRLVPACHGPLFVIRRTGRFGAEGCVHDHVSFVLIESSNLNVDGFSVTSQNLLQLFGFHLLNVIMSTEPTTRSRRASRRSNVTADQPSPLSSSPVGAIRKSRGRPSLGSISMASSASSKLSGTFDVEKSIPPRPESPPTPACETPPPSEHFTAPAVHIIGQGIDNLPLSEPKPRKRAWADENPPQSSEIADTPLKSVRKRSRPKTSKLSDVRQPDAPVPVSLLTPGINVAGHQRTRSAPPLPSRREESMDGDRPRMPGRWDSQSSKIDVENSEGKQIQHSRSEDRQQGEEETGQPAEPTVDEDDSIDDEEAKLPDMSIEKVSFQHVLSFQHLLLACFNPLKWLLQLMHILLDPIPPTKVPEHLPQPFIPFTCEDDHPGVRKLNGQRAIHIKMLKLIQETQEKPAESGWVYVLESREYGPEFLKIGKSGNPDERLRQLQRECGLHLREISDKNENPFHFFHLVEKLVLQELDDDRLKLQCQGPKCTTLHKEWVKIRRQKALRAIVKWRKWLLIQKPFDESGQLTPYWADRSKRLRIHIVDVRWEQWTQPSRWDWYMFTLGPHIFRYILLFKGHFAHNRKDLCFWIVGMTSTFLSFAIHGGYGAIWTFVLLLLL